MESLVGQRLHLLRRGRPPTVSRNIDGGNIRILQVLIGGWEVRIVPLDDVVGVLLLALGEGVVPLELALRPWLPDGKI